jgi:hypothetical protein
MSTHRRRFDQMRIPVFFGKRGTPRNAVVRPIKDVLKDKSGAGIAAELGGIALLMVITGSVAVGVTTNTKAVQTFSVKAERQALISSLVDDQRQGATWGTPAAPTTQTMTLENGQSAKVTLWRVATPVGTSLTAVTATSTGPAAADCTGPAAVEKTGCIYAYRFHANDMSSINPDTIIRKDPSTAAGGVIGTVDGRVSTANSIPQGTVFATGTDAGATSWRYLVNARSVQATGEIRFSQAGKILAVIPVTPTTNNYYGTFSAVTGVPVTASVVEGNVIVQTVMTYRAGGS